MSTSNRVSQEIIDEGMTVKWLEQPEMLAGFVLQTLVDDGTGQDQLVTISKQPGEGHSVAATVQDLVRDDYCPRPATKGRPVPADLPDVVEHVSFREGEEYDALAVIIRAAARQNLQR